MSEHAAALAARLGDEWKALCREVFSPPPPVRVPGPLAEQTPESVLKPITERSHDHAWPERIIGMTLNGPRVPLPALDAGFVQALHAIVGLREGMARWEGERQARLQSTRDATSAKQKIAADRVDTRRNKIRDICSEKGWSRSTRGLLKQVLHELDARGLAASKNTIYADLRMIFPKNDVVGIRLR
jgi:hypothetical protein